MRFVSCLVTGWAAVCLGCAVGTGQNGARMPLHPYAGAAGPLLVNQDGTLKESIPAQQRVAEASSSGSGRGMGKLLTSGLIEMSLYPTEVGLSIVRRMMGEEVVQIYDVDGGVTLRRLDSGWRWGSGASSLGSSRSP